MNLEINDRTTGFLVLLSFVLALYFLKSIPIHSTPPGAPGEGDFFIEVSGDVKSPGVYRFNDPPDIMNLMDKAGGLCSDTARPDGFGDGLLSSGKVLIVRQEGPNTEFLVAEMSAFYKITLGIPISVNEESEIGLTAIPGIGTVLAKAIVQKRSERGGFERLSDILSVKGIGPKLYERIKPYVSL